MERKCENCDYWNEAQYQCRRYAPRLAFDSNGNDGTDWANTGAVDWCGEFREKGVKK